MTTSSIKYNTIWEDAISKDLNLLLVSKNWEMITSNREDCGISQGRSYDYYDVCAWMVIGQSYSELTEFLCYFTFREHSFHSTEKSVWSIMWKHLKRTA